MSEEERQKEKVKDCERGSKPSSKPDLLMGRAVGIQRLPLSQDASLARKTFFMWGRI